MLLMSWFFVLKNFYTKAKLKLLMPPRRLPHSVANEINVYMFSSRETNEMKPKALSNSAEIIHLLEDSRP